MSPPTSKASEDTSRAKRPLEGIRVLDLTRLLPGGHCTLLLADMGAEVIKVEDLRQGDYMRWMPPLLDRYGAYFHAFNGGKKSVRLNLKTDTGRQIFRKLVGYCDVLVEGFRPGVMAALQIDSDAMRKINPRLIFCSISGYGQDGPYRSRAGHDLNYAGLAGLLPTPNPDPDQAESSFPLPRAQVADIGGGYAAALSILGALYACHQTGKGTFLDISLAEAALTFAVPRLVRAAYTETGKSIPPQQGEELTGAFACYNVYRTADHKYITLGARELKFWKAFLAAVGREDLLDQQYDPARQTELKRIVAGIFLQRNRDEWLELLGEKADACCEPLQEGSDVLHHPQFEARNVFSSRLVGSSVLLQVACPAGMRPPHRPPAPGYGEHTAEVLAACEFSREEMIELHQSGIIRLGHLE